MNFPNLINVNKNCNPNHRELFKSTDREIFFYGGTSAGKSYSVVDKLLLQPVFQKKRIRTLVVRKTFPSLKRTCIPLMESRAEKLGIPFALNKSDFVARSFFGSQFIFLSMNNRGDYEKVKSITDIDYIWTEETNELSEPAYDLLKLRLRGGDADYSQLINTFNPIGKTSWIFNREFKPGAVHSSKHIRTTILDNPWHDKEFLKELKKLKKTNKNLYQVYYLGEWGLLEGAVYNHYQVLEGEPSSYDEIIYGLDFGYNSPTALVKIYIADERNIFIEELLYETHLTNNDLIERLKILDKDHNIRHTIIYSDHEPDRVDELIRAGFTVIPGDKSFAGIDFLKGLNLFIDSESVNLLKEIQSYVWAETPDGLQLDRPVKFMDHALDAARYAIFTHLKNLIPVTSPDSIKAGNLGL